MYGVLLTLFVAQILLALSQSQHFRVINPTSARDPRKFPPISFALRASGYTFLLLSMALTIVRWGPGLGLTYWFGIFAFTGLMVALCLENLTRRPR